MPPSGCSTSRVPGGRGCDQAARHVLGHPRSGAIVTPPARATTDCRLDAQGLNPSQPALLPQIAEVAREIQPYHQRTVYEGHPELSFLQTQR